MGIQIPFAILIVAVLAGLILGYIATGRLRVLPQTRLVKAMWDISALTMFVCAFAAIAQFLVILSSWIG
jgi:hypothetical protein